MADAALRWIEMLRLIPRDPHRISTTELHRKLTDLGYQISERSLQRNLSDASLTFPIQSDEDSKPYHWWYPANFVLDLPALSPSIALAFALLHQHGEQLLPNGVRQHLEPWFRSADEVLNRQAGSMANWRQQIRVVSDGMALLPPKVDEVIQSRVQEAVMQRRRFRALYKGRRDPEPRTHLVNPLGLVARHQVLYLVATLWDYQDPIQLALHRFVEVELLDEESHPPEGFDLDEYISSGAFGLLRSAEQIPLKLKINKRRGIHLLETPLSADQQVAAEDEKYLTLRATVPDTAQLEWWLMSFGADAEVLEPLALREKLVRIVHSMTKVYSPPCDK